MRIETNLKNIAYLESRTIRFNDTDVVFKRGKAEVSDELGKFIIDNFKGYFPEGKQPEIQKEDKIHPFDQQAFEERGELIVKLKSKLTQRENTIRGLEGDLAEWKKLYTQLESQFNNLKDIKVEKTKVKAKKAAKPEKKDEKSDTEIRKKLEAKVIEEIKKIAFKMEIDESKVEGKKLKQDWIDAIIKHS